MARRHRIGGLNHRPEYHPLDSGRHHHDRRITLAEVHRIEDQIAAHSRAIETLLLDNQRLAASHVALKQDVVAAQQDLRHISATASSVKAERDAQVREVYERSLRVEAEARSIGGLSAELERVRVDINGLRKERDELLERLKDIDGDTARTRLELQQLADLKGEIEAMRRENDRGRSAIEYERKMCSDNFELSQAMEKHMTYLAHEAEKLRFELANAEKRAMAAANPVPGYVVHQANFDPGYGGNSLWNPHAVHQFTFNAGSNYGPGAEPLGPPGVPIPPAAPGLPGPPVLQGPLGQ